MSSPKIDITRPQSCRQDCSSSRHRRWAWPTRDAASITGGCFASTARYTSTMPWGSELLSNLSPVLQRYQQDCLTLSCKKYVFLQTSLPFLGRIFTAEGLITHPEKVRVVTKLPTPTPGGRNAIIPGTNRLSLLN